MTPMIRPATAEPTILLMTMWLRRTGRVSSVSRVRFSFSMPIEDITEEAPMMTSIMMAMGMTRVRVESRLEISAGVSPATVLP